MHIYHTALTVKNLAKSIDFYQKIFQLKIAVEGERPEINLKFVMLEDQNGQRLELLSPTEPVILETKSSDLNVVGLKHIAFAVEDIEEVFNSCLENGAKVIWPIKKGVSVKKIAFISDPDGITIELAQL